jgi:hypothetical protein
MAKVNSNLFLLDHPDHVVYVASKLLDDEHLGMLLDFCEQAPGEYWCGYDNGVRTGFYFNLKEVAFEFKMRFG